MMAVENPQIHHLIETNCAAGKDFFANVINENCDQILLLLSNIGNPLPYRIFFFVSSVRPENHTKNCKLNWGVMSCHTIHIQMDFIKGFNMYSRLYGFQCLQITIKFDKSPWSKI